MPFGRRITAKVTVELGRVPFGCAACRQAVRSPSDARITVAVLTVGREGGGSDGLHAFGVQHRSLLQAPQG